ncbi:unnamed protein product [Spirodela intermedia]|uniref:Extradiol ring-cleavage dioxygenase class III enzyme subunit B domain-containing protein n=1 Tax=Spirodela intermedia TaxID=51605 RepID=A0A7I8JDJ4_SPIIN|nr:unnamed protein product [Spirodela intermedia]CAA6667795.1 unnamed protein product [Spirodela intermedia]
MDTFFISHGSPTLSIDESLPARHFLQSWRAKTLQTAPKAILVVSAHWDTSSPVVNAVDRNDTIYDFYGFPKPMYQVCELLAGAGFGATEVDRRRGLDHGAWVPLMLMYPEADIPVCQLSVQSSRDGAHHYKLGQALAPLRHEGVLIIGSGSATTTCGSYALARRSSRPSGRWISPGEGPFCQARPPWPEHFFPLHVALGAAGADAQATLIHDSISLGSLSYASYRFSPKP